MLPLPELVLHLRRQRLLLGLTQTALAKQAGVSQSLVAKLEAGRLNPSYESVRRIQSTLDNMSVREETTAKDLMQREPVWAEPKESLGVALARMKSEGFSQLPVVADGVPVGSLSEAAILNRIERGADLERLKREPVERIMGHTFPSVDPGASRRALLEMLREREAVLVLDGGRLVGVVTKSDLW